MQRYRPSIDSEDGNRFNGMVGDEGGKYVMFDDHQAAIDAVLKEAIWATEIIKAIFVVDGDECQLRAHSFLASPAVRDYRARQEQR